MKNMKRMLSLLLLAAVLLTAIPVMTSASETSEVTVYLTVSKNKDFITKNGTVMALEEITVPYFDLALYGLEGFYYNPACYAKIGTEKDPALHIPGTAATARNNVTMMHLLIYATEVYCYNVAPANAGKGYLKTSVWDQTGVTNYLEIGGTVGSAFMEFWDFGTKCNYYLNYAYPLGAPGWGASSDQVLLEDGDVVTVRYNANTGTDGSYYHFGQNGDLLLTATRGQSVALSLYQAVANSDYTTGRTAAGAGQNVYVTAGSAPAAHTGLTATATTNASGQVTLNTANLNPGLYYVTTNTHDPAVVMLMVRQPLPGDLNGDGVLGLTEIAKVLKHYKSDSGLTDAQESAIDTNGSGILDILEIASVLKTYK